MIAPQVQCRRGVPVDFRVLAPTMTKYELERHYSASYKTVSKWFKATGLKPRAPIMANAQPVPSDFAEVSQRLTVSGMREYYGGGEAKIRRWLQETGLTPCKIYNGGKAPKRNPNRTSFRPNQMPTLIAGQDHRIRSIHDEAADVLRRERWVVYRSTETGRADHKGEFWRVGNTVLTPDELLARADRYRSAAA